MNAADFADAAPEALARPRRLRRALLWALLVALLLVAQTLLVALTVNYEAGREQDRAERAATQAAAELRRELLRQMQQLQALAFTEQAPVARQEAVTLLRARQGLERLEWRDAQMRPGEQLDTPFAPTLFSQMSRTSLVLEAELACNEAQRTASPAFSRSYFVPLPAGAGVEVVDLCVPLQRGAHAAGYLIGSFALGRVLESVLSAQEARHHEYAIVEADGTRLARAGVGRGAGVYVARQIVDLPGTTLHVRADAQVGRPSLLPNVTTALVMGLSLALFAVVLLLVRDARRRAQAEQGLAEALAFRNAMEDSLPTGLRARDLQGAVSYANPAFCAMVGFTQEELRSPQAMAGSPPYWPPEFSAEYQRRQRLRLGGQGRSTAEAKEGYETVFMRKSGERFPVMIYEAPLVDGKGRQTGWMSAVLDLSAQRRVEDLSRQQQDRLQASARLATVGEMASLLSHELNQPLAAIASYATGSLNLIDSADEQTPAMLQLALSRIAEQADRAGRVIKSVHAFVRRRDQLHETTSALALFEAVLPLVRMQARKSGARVELDLPPPASADGSRGMAPRVRCDRTMVEQVLLNLSRNGLQAMESATALQDRVLTLRARQTHPRWVTFSVSDAGPGIEPEVAAKLFTPFFSTRSEGMGLGLSLCRTVIEQHGGALDFGPGPQHKGTEFRFTLPTPKSAEGAEGAESGETSGSADKP
jgi:two-component system sensor histidine kinase DctS